MQSELTPKAVNYLTLEDAVRVIHALDRNGGNPMASAFYEGMSLEDAVNSSKAPKKKKSPEKRVQTALRYKLGGHIEVETPVGRIDLLTHDELIEVKQVKDWKGAIGQLLTYGYYYPDHALRLHLYGKCHSDTYDLIEMHCSRLGIRVTH